MESFNGKLQDELLNQELLLSLDEARYVLNGLRLDYTTADRTRRWTGNPLRGVRS